MVPIHTHYDNLKVARNAPPEVIRAAYKTLSQKYHPDRNGNSPEAIRVIQIINSAYAVLSDPEKRREHDEWIAHAEDQPRHHAENMETLLTRERKRSPRRRHRKSLFAFLRPRHEPSLNLHRLLDKARMTLDVFSRKLFRKT